jgi:hypothetical protein
MSAKNLSYAVLKTEEGEFITVVAPGHPPRNARYDHPYYDKIKRLVEQDDLAALDLFDATIAISKKFERLSDRVAVKNRQLFFDGDPINNALSAQILRFLDEGVEDWKPLVAFFEKVQANPVDHSREQLFKFLDSNGMVISLAEDGDIVAYKGMRKHTDDEGKIYYQPTHHGHVIIDGVDFARSNDPEARQYDGSVVEMPRSEVRHDPHQHCSVGLHIATFSFAKSYGDAIVEVRVNPRDVVSVPNDSSQKVRACRYRIVGPVKAPHKSAVVPADEKVWFDKAPKDSVTSPKNNEDGKSRQEESNVTAVATKPQSSTARKRYPKPADFERIAAEAKAKKKGLLKYAQAHTSWTFVGDDPKNRKDWRA